MVQPAVAQKYLEKKILESFKKQSWMCHAVDYFHSIHIVLGIISDIELI